MLPDSALKVLCPLADLFTETQVRNSPRIFISLQKASLLSAGYGLRGGPCEPVVYTTLTAATSDRLVCLQTVRCPNQQILAAHSWGQYYTFSSYLSRGTPVRILHAGRWDMHTVYSVMKLRNDAPSRIVSRHIMYRVMSFHLHFTVCLHWRKVCAAIGASDLNDHFLCGDSTTSTCTLALIEIQVCPFL